MPQVRLVPFEADNAVHVAELKRQRILCGWGIEVLDKWCEQSRKGEKILNWMFPLEGEEELFTLPKDEVCALTKEVGPSPPNPSFQPLGHMGLNWVDDYGDLTQANKEENRICFTTFFILVSQQGKKIGSASMDEIEKLAAKMGAKTITLQTLLGDSARRREYWEGHGLQYFPERMINEDWYARRGYVAYHSSPSIPHYKEDGTKIMLDAVKMSKPLSGIET